MNQKYMDTQDLEKISKNINNSFTKTQTVFLVIGIVIAWSGAVWWFGNNTNVFGGDKNASSQNTGGATPVNVYKNQSTNLATVAQLPSFIRGNIKEIKETELILIMDYTQGKFAQGATRHINFNAKTRFVERVLKSTSELNEIMQKYFDAHAANSNQDIPFPQTYLSEREIAKDELKARDTISVFAKDTGKETITADIVARITNP